MSSKFQVGQMISARDLVGETLCELAKTDDRIWALTSDCGGNLNKFKKLYPDRFVDTGIAEQNAAGIAAGLALSGAIPHIMGMTPFVTMRAFEQNRSSIAYQNLPVRIIGSCGGMTTGGGSTHYAMEDIAIMRSIANMSVVSLSDPSLAEAVLVAGLDYDGPIFLRLALGKSDPVVYAPGTVDFKFGKGHVAREGNDVTILAHGCMVLSALHVAEELEKENISVRVIDMLSIKPIDAELIVKCAEETERILVWEDHFAMGGMASAVADVIADRCIKLKKFVRVGIPELYPGFGKDKDLYEKYGMDENTVKELIRRMK